MVNLWSLYGQRILQVGIGLMLAAAIWRLWLEMPPFISGQYEIDAIDMINRHIEVHRWFAGQLVYGGAIKNGDYPPASYTMLWPFLGWLDLTSARYLWALIYLGLLGWLAWLGALESLASTFWEKMFMVIMPFALYPASTGIRVGQIAINVIPSLVMGLLLMQPSSYRRYDRLGRDILASAMFIFALVKPTLSVPFFWIVCFMPGRCRLFWLVSFGYSLLALIAIFFQNGNLLSLHRDWLEQSGNYLLSEGYANIHTWLEVIGLSDWMLPASLILFIVTGVWTLLYRKVDLWILLGVAALVSRFWTDHRLYDDLLIWIPMITLYRLAKVTSLEKFILGQPAKLIAAVLFALNWFVLLGPARFVINPLLSSSPFEVVIKIGVATLWLTCLIFFILLAHQQTAKETSTP